MNQLNFERMKKTLSNGVIPTVTATTHRANQLIMFDDITITMRAILASPICPFSWTRAHFLEQGHFVLLPQAQGLCHLSACRKYFLQD